MGDKFTFAHISSSVSEPTKPFAVKLASPFIWAACQQQACLRSVAALLALLLGRERRGWFCCSQLLCPENLEMFLVPCPAYAEVEQFVRERFGFL